MSGSLQLSRGIIILLLFSALGCVPLSRAEQRAPQHRTPHSATKSQELAPAEALLQQGQVAEAKSSTLEYLRQHPSSVDGYNLLGIISSNARDYEGALDAFQHAVKLNPSSPKSHNNLANLYAAASDRSIMRSRRRLGPRSVIVTSSALSFSRLTTRTLAPSGKYQEAAVSW